MTSTLYSRFVELFLWSKQVANDPTYSSHLGNHSTINYVFAPLLVQLQPSHHKCIEMKINFMNIYLKPDKAQKGLGLFKSKFWHGVWTNQIKVLPETNSHKQHRHNQVPVDWNVWKEPSLRPKLKPMFCPVIVSFY